MSFPSSHQSSLKRPRLSLQIRTTGSAQTVGKSATALKADIDPSSPTAFNTLSNAYAAAIENASPLTGRPPLGPEGTGNSRPSFLKLETSSAFQDNYSNGLPSQRTQTPGPVSITCPDTPNSAHPISTPATARPDSGVTTFAFTPPQSAGAVEPTTTIFAFAAAPVKGPPRTPRTPKRRATTGSQSLVPPYTHPRSLRSILRNSPLPPRCSVTPATPSRMSIRVASRAAKKVGYDDPLTQTITTNRYVKSHIDLLSEDSPFSATDPEEPQKGTLDLAMTYTGDETRDGGQTPGPFEDMSRRMAESGLETPASRKPKRKEKKRKWRWTLGEDGEEIDCGNLGASSSTKPETEKTPVTAIERAGSISSDEAMSDSHERPSSSQSL